MTRTEAYWLGYRHGRTLSDHRPNENHEPRLRLEVALVGRGGPTGHRRAFALGELRGYRQAER